MKCRNFQWVCSLLLHRNVFKNKLRIQNRQEIWIQVKLENNCNLKGKFTKLDWNGLVWKNQMEPLQFQSIFKIVMVTQSIPGLVGLIGLISPRLDWLLIRWVWAYQYQLPSICTGKSSIYDTFYLTLIIIERLM